MAPSVLRLTLAAASSAAWASAAAPEDVAALLQTHAAVAGESSQSHRDDKEYACRCLSWSQAYEDYGVRCGLGGEFRWVGKAKTKEGELHNVHLENEMCEHFYKHFNESYCVERNFNSRATSQWCFVSAECQDLNGGGPIQHSAASWKVCNSSVDRLLYDQTPEKLYEIAQSTHQDPAYMLKMAYPVWAKPEKETQLHWPGVQAALGLRKPRNGNLTEKVEGLKYIQSLNQPWILDSWDSRTPFGLVWGKKILEVDYTPWFWTQSDDFLSIFKRGLQNLATEYKCLQGCD